MWRGASDCAIMFGARHLSADLQAAWQAALVVGPE